MKRIKRVICFLLIVAIYFSCDAICNAKTVKDMVTDEMLESAKAVQEETGISAYVLIADSYYESTCGSNMITNTSKCCGWNGIGYRWNKGVFKQLGYSNGDQLDCYKSYRICAYILLNHLEDEESDLYVALTSYRWGAYSQQVKDVKNGASCKYADNVLNLASELEDYFIRLENAKG